MRKINAMNFTKRLAMLASFALIGATLARAQTPVFNSPLTVTGYVGVALSYRITTDVAATFGVGALPPGLLYNGLLNVISGTPQNTGTLDVVLTATNASSISFTSTTNLTLVLLPATPSPVITSAASYVGYVGVPVDYQIVATNATGYGASGLPLGWAVDSLSGKISGTPTLTGVQNITLIASNATSLPGKKTLALAILSAVTTNLIFSEGFEGTFPSGWQVGDANASGTPAYWAGVSSPFAGISAAAGSRMAYCAGIGYSGSSDSPKYQNNMAAYLQRTFDLSGSSSVTLSFRSRIPGIEAGFDTCRVRVSTDAGSHWTDAWNVSRVDGGWTTETVALDAYAGQATVTIRFEFDSDSSMNSTGWFLDEIWLSTAQGDRFDNATLIGRGTNHAGSVPAPNALDVSRVTLRKGYSYVITATAGSLFDPQMWLLDPSRNQLAYNDDAAGLGLNARITYNNCPATGDYYVRVGGVAGGAGSYTLLVAEQPATADVQAIAVTLMPPDGDARGKHPTNLTYRLQNNGPMSLDNGETYSYRVEVYLSTNGNASTGAGTGATIGSETIQLDLASGDNTDVPGDATAYTIPEDLPAGNYYVWLHITPLSGAPTDSKSVNNWVVSTNAAVALPPPATVTITGIATKSGGLSGMPGVTITLLGKDGSTTNVITDSYGNYSVFVSNGWSGTLTPSSTAVGAFSPALRACTNVTANLASQNFAFGSLLVISGRITAKSGTSQSLTNGVTITFAGSGITTVTTDANGYYSNVVVSGWTGTVTPATNGLGGAFSPVSQAYSKLAASKVNQNFTWTPPPVISGKVTVKGSKIGATNMVMVLSGVGTTTTDANGNYAMTVPYNWTGTVTPSANGRGGTFSPGFKAFSKLTSGKTQNFTWTAPVVRALFRPAIVATPVARSAGRAPTPVGVVAAAGAAPQPWLHSAGLVRWTGADATRARQAPVLLTISLASGVATVAPAVPLTAPGDMSTVLEFVDGVAGMAGTLDGELITVRNVNGLATAEITQTGLIVVGDVRLVAARHETILTWNLRLLQP